MEDRKERRLECKKSWKNHKKSKNKKISFNEFWRKFNKSIGGRKCKRKLK